MNRFYDDGGEIRYRCFPFHIRRANKRPINEYSGVFVYIYQLVASRLLGMVHSTELPGDSDVASVLIILAYYPQPALTGR